MNTTSLASFRMTKNQLQAFYFTIIKWSIYSKRHTGCCSRILFCIELLWIYSFKRLNIYSSFIDNFEYELTNLYLDPLGIKYDSTISNTYNIFWLLLLMIILRLEYLFQNEHFFITGSNTLSWWITTINWIIDKILKLMTFEYFIRKELNFLYLFLYLLWMKSTNITLKALKDYSRLFFQL